jgi:hypothetical protein
MNVRELALNYKPRPWQAVVHQHRTRFTICEVHRRGGKTELGFAELAFAALARPGARCLFLAPLKLAAKQIAWTRLVEFLRPVTATLHESEGRVTLINGSTIQLSGEGEEGQHLRGQSFHAIVIDEFAQFSDETFFAVLRPCLSDTRGEALFISTPSGGKDALYRLKQATRGDPEWSSFVFKASETGVLPLEEFESARRSMPPWTFAAEYECDADAPAPGAVFGAAMALAREEGRLHPSITIEPDLALQAALDLGISDATSVWLYQAMPAEVRLLAYREFNGTGLREVALALRDQGVTAVTVPHDIKVRELLSGRSRLELLEDLGFDVRIAPSVSVDEGLYAAERLLARCHFDLKHADLGIDRLRGYRRDVKTGKPVHDDSSHGADAFRYLALALTDSGPVRRVASGAVVPVRTAPRVLPSLSRSRR